MEEIPDKPSESPKMGEEDAMDTIPENGPASPRQETNIPDSNKGNSEEGTKPVKRKKMKKRRKKEKKAPDDSLQPDAEKKSNVEGAQDDGNLSDDSPRQAQLQSGENSMSSYMSDSSPSSPSVRIPTGEADALDQIISGQMELNESSGSPDMDLGVPNPDANEMDANRATSPAISIPRSMNFDMLDEESHKEQPAKPVSPSPDLPPGETKEDKNEEATRPSSPALSVIDMAREAISEEKDGEETRPLSALSIIDMTKEAGDEGKEGEEGARPPSRALSIIDMTLGEEEKVGEEGDRPPSALSIIDMTKDGDGDGDDSDEGDKVGTIRIRDFGALKETSSEDEDDDVVEIPIVHTHWVRMEDAPECSNILMECEEENNALLSIYRKNLNKFETAKTRVMGIQKLLTNPAQNGQTLQNITHVVSNVSGRAQVGATTQVQTRGYTQVPRYVSPGPTYRFSPGRPPMNIVRTRAISTIQNGATVNTAGKQMNMIGMGSVPPLTQLIFDPNTGLLLCPTPGGGNTMQALRPTGQALQTIQNASQLATSRYTAVSRVNPTPQYTQQYSTPTSVSNTATNFTVDPRRPLAALRAIPPPRTASQMVRAVRPAAQMPTASSLVTRVGQTNSNLGVNNANRMNRVRVVTAQEIADLRGKTPIRPAPTSQPFAKSFPAPTASSTVRLLNQQRGAAAAAAMSSVSVTGSARGPVEEVTAGTLLGTGPADKDPQNSKTFPSLVVMVKPCLQEKLTKAQMANSRTDLDLQVKTILMYSPAKFTEWLMQKGLLRVDHKCSLPNHRTPYKLGMYSDGASKHPFSGGYVWISDCCSDQQISVFQGSIFEASVYPPGTLMKLIYHWSCQTPAVNVLQWVKVTSYYLKNFYTLLRSACVAGLYENCPLLGGAGKYIEVGIITLGTTVASNPGQQHKQVKIEILGVFDPAAKSIRMKVINPQTVGQQSEINNERISQILWPLNNWVDKKSIILIDLSMDKPLLEEMGFASVSQSKGNALQNMAQKSLTPTNVNVMNYLKNVVPKMFQNTLCVLSKSLIQQFLDELSWREIWGNNPTSAFNSIVEHLIQMTKADTGESLFSRLNKISLNPFTEWSFNPKPATGIECLPESIRGGADLVSAVPEFAGFDGLGEIAANYMRNRTPGSTFNAQKPKPSTAIPSNSNGSENASGALKRKMLSPANVTAELTKHLVKDSPRIFTLQLYYYIYCAPSPRGPSSKIPRGAFPQNLKCPLCSKLFVSNYDAMKHIIIHVVNVGRSSLTQAICNYCLKEVSPASSLPTHIHESHKLVDIPFCCRICNEKFASETSMILHMWQHHVQCEAPYHCEVCDYRSSYHYEVVDHFHKMHNGLDCVQCPLCLKVISTRSFSDLKILVVHLQNHTIKKGKKCLDCCLMFGNDLDYKAHMTTDRAHESRIKEDFIQQKILGEAVKMAQPPSTSRAMHSMVPAKKARTYDKRSDGPAVTTLNSELSVPINPSEKFTKEWCPGKLPNTVDKSLIRCWECHSSVDLHNHLTGLMKCTKCFYRTHCAASMSKHSKFHTHGNLGVQVGPQQAKPIGAHEDLCCGCGYRTRFGDKMAAHLQICDQKVAVPLRDDKEDMEDDDGPPVLLPQLPTS